MVFFGKSTIVLGVKGLREKTLDDFIVPYEYHMDLCDRLYLSGRLAIMCGKNFNVGHDMQTVQSNFFMPTMLIGAFDFYHIILLSLTLPLPGVIRSAQSKTPVGFIFFHTFHLMRMKFGVAKKQFKLNILQLLFSKI